MTQLVCDWAKPTPHTICLGVADIAELIVVHQHDVLPAFIVILTALIAICLRLCNSVTLDALLLNHG